MHKDVHDTDSCRSGRGSLWQQLADEQQHATERCLLRLHDITFQQAPDMLSKVPSPETVSVLPTTAAWTMALGSTGVLVGHLLE